MFLDRRIPAVYVDVEDRGTSLPPIEIGESVYVVILSDRGRHNQVVEHTTLTNFYNEFGKPDYQKYGQGHYLAEKALQMGAKLFVTRAALISLDDAELESSLMAIANTAISYNTGDTTTAAVTGSFVFGDTSTLNIVSFGEGEADTLSLGDWIFPQTGDAADSRQIVAIDTTTNEITLDDDYGGVNVTDDIYVYTPVETSSIANARSLDDLIAEASTLWYFYAIGAGTYYNDIYVRAIRNIAMERTYTDDDGAVLYPYLFMDLYVYKYNDDGTSTLMEGPWTVSLCNKTATNQVIKDINTGNELYIVTVVNENSSLIRMKESTNASVLMTLSQTYPYALDVQKRLQVQALFASGTVLRLTNIGEGGFYLSSGEDGSLFNSNGTLNLTDEYNAIIANAYNGTLVSTDGSIETIAQVIYPPYLFNYIVAGGYNEDVQNAARSLVDNRGDCMLLADPGANNSTAAADITDRDNDVNWNTYNVMMYTQYREIFDTHTGKKFYINPVYHALERHLYVDSKYWIAEPVANIEKGILNQKCTLSYTPNITELGDLIEKELNPVITEPDGKYILTQNTMWKRNSSLKRGYVVKFVHYIKREIPKILKDLLQRKATPYWINQASTRVNGFMKSFVQNNSSDRYVALESYTAAIVFDEVRSELNVVLNIKPIGFINSINVTINVY